MPQIMTIRETVARAREDGLTVTENALRTWVRSGAIPARRAGRTFLLYYPNVERFLKCEDGGDMKPIPSPAPLHGIRPVSK